MSVLMDVSMYKIILVLTLFSYRKHYLPNANSRMNNIWTRTRSWNCQLSRIIRTGNSTKFWNNRISCRDTITKHVTFLFRKFPQFPELFWDWSGGGQVKGKSIITEDSDIKSPVSVQLDWLMFIYLRVFVYTPMFTCVYSLSTCPRSLTSVTVMLLDFVRHKQFVILFLESFLF